MQIEDYSLIFAGFGFAAFTAVMLAAGHAGQGRHQWDVSIAGVQRVAFLANILEVVYPPVMFAAKLTVLLQIKRIFTAHQKDFIYWSVHVLIAANCLTYFACFVAFIFACWPREKIWSPHIPGKCISTNASIIATSAINVISDVTILLLPIHRIFQLHIPLRKKVGVGAIFATGAFFLQSTQSPTLIPHTHYVTPYLNACIDETLRLYPVLLTAGARQTKESGITIAGQYIPPYTNIIAPRYSIGRLEGYFQRAVQFIPERWTERAEMVKDHRAHNPFNIGRHTCPGRWLGLIEIRIVVALLLTRFEVTLVPDKWNETEVFDDMKDNFTAQPGRLELIFRKL